MSDLIGGKRKRADDDYDPSDQVFGTDLVGSNANVQNKRPRTAAFSDTLHVCKSLCSDISKLGDNGLKSFFHDINYQSEPIAQEIDNEEFRDAFLTFLSAMMIEQSHKDFHVASLILLANAKNPKVGHYVVDFLHCSMQDVLDRVRNNSGDKDEDEVFAVVFGTSECGTWTRLKLYFKFLACISPMLEEDDAFEVFEQFLSLALGLQQQFGTDKRCALAELLYYNVLVALPYLVAADPNNESIRDKCGNIMEQAEAFKVVEPPCLNLVNPFPHQAESLTYSQSILPALKELQSINWDATLFTDVNELVGQTLVASQLESGEFAKHSFPALVPPDVDGLKLHADLSMASGNIDTLWRNPRVQVECFPKDQFKFETKPPLTSYAGILLRDVTQDIVQNMEFNKTSVAKQLGALHHFFDERLFADPDASYEKLEMIHDKLNGVDVVSQIQNKMDADDVTREMLFHLNTEVEDELTAGFHSTFKVQEVYTEAIFDLMLALPMNSNPAIYYHTVLVECCSRNLSFLDKFDPDHTKARYVKVLGRAIRFFYQNASTLDSELRMRFVDWFATQMNNFDFHWNWSEWAPSQMELEAIDFHPQIVVVKNIIAKEVRLTNAATIRASIPEALHKYLSLNLRSSAQATELDREFFGPLAGKPGESDQDDPGLFAEFTFNNKDYPYADLCTEVYDYLMTPDSPFQELNDLILRLKERLAEDETYRPANLERYVTNLITQSVGLIGSTSISLAAFSINMLLPKLKKIFGLPNDIGAVENDQFPERDEKGLSETRRWIIQSVRRLWNREPKVAYIILDVYLSLGILSKLEIIDVFFQLEESIPLITDFAAAEYCFKLVSDSIDDDAVFQRFTGNYLTLLNHLVDEILKGGQQPISRSIRFPQAEKENLKWAYIGLMDIFKIYLRRCAEWFSTNSASFISQVEGVVGHAPTRDKIIASLHDAESM